ncbi:MAG TPA: hypothetical protein VM240_05470 [Verrucomicrobiae bacterium]|nr:hypothetical protein [Verrucomicrobiae bacterium]
MPWFRKDAYKELVRDLGGRYTEHQVKGTWYGRASFQTTEAAVMCDLVLGGAEAVRPDDAIVSTKYTGNAPTLSDTARFAQTAARKRFSLPLRACMAAANNRDRALEGKEVAAYAKKIVDVTARWGIAIVELPKPRWLAEFEAEINLDSPADEADLLVREGRITFLPLA